MQALDTAQLIALAGALGWASGVRLYLVVLLTGLAGFMGWVPCRPACSCWPTRWCWASAALWCSSNFLPTRSPAWIRCGTWCMA
jgi:hypothetical protein